MTFKEAKSHGSHCTFTPVSLDTWNISQKWQVSAIIKSKTSLHQTEAPCELTLLSGHDWCCKMLMHTFSTTFLIEGKLKTAGVERLWHTLQWPLSPCSQALVWGEKKDPGTHCLRMLKVSYRQQCGLSVAKKKFQCSGVACRLPREVANSVYRLFSSPNTRAWKRGFEHHWGVLHS